jgi:hypothetical protein
MRLLLCVRRAKTPERSGDSSITHLLEPVSSLGHFAFDPAMAHPLGDRPQLRRSSRPQVRLAGGFPLLMSAPQTLWAAVDMADNRFLRQRFVLFESQVLVILSIRIHVAAAPN